MPGMVTTYLDPELRAELVSHSHAALPEEACGLLLGAGDQPVEVVALPNLARRPECSYTIDPLDYLRAERDAERLGRWVMGVWHSHPGARAVPSETDRDAAWEGWLYVIVGFPEDANAELRGWRLQGDRFLEEELS